MSKKVDIDEILKQMTIKEKIMQMTQIAGYVYQGCEDTLTGPLHDLNMSEEDLWMVGSVLSVTSPEEMIEIQKTYLEKSRLKIPLIFMADIIHGVRTIFPIPLAMGCSWNENTVKKALNSIKKEMALTGIHVTFSPMVDVARDARWGRVMESTGEDVFLNSYFAKAFVEGYQGDMTDQYDIAACVKHYAAYGACESGRDYNTVDMSESTLREYYLPPYKAAVDSKSEMLMTSFNSMNGVPSTGNKHLMKDILRNEWNYDGVVVSDWGAIQELINHGVAENQYQAAEISLENQVDMEMMTPCYNMSYQNLFANGKLSIEMLDRSVKRILKLKEKLGLFENPYKCVDVNKAKEVCLSKEQRTAAREVASDTMVLLKNDGVLPLSKDKKVAVVGPFADNGEILGEWAWQGKSSDTVTLKKALVSRLGRDNVITSKGCDIDSTDTKNIIRAVHAAQKADVVIIAVGEDQTMSGESQSRAYLTLPGVQENLIKEIVKLKKPTVVVLFNGRPIEISNFANDSLAILEAWFPGTEGGNAIADILFGDKNPHGKLTMSFPYTVGQCPIYYNHYNTGRPRPDDTKPCRYTSQYIDCPNKPLYPFGYGKSYSTFEYSEIKLDKSILKYDNYIKASVKVKNTGDVKGIETVQLYIRDLFASKVRPVKELKGFKQIELEPSEEKTVEFIITEKMLRFYNCKNELKSEKGIFHLFIGADSSVENFAKFELK